MPEISIPSGTHLKRRQETGDRRQDKPPVPSISCFPPAISCHPPIAAHLFIFYFAVLSFLTPPVCVAVYVAAAIAGTEVMRTAFQAVKLGIVAYIVPFIFVYSPALLLQGSGGDIAIVVISALLGFIFLAIAIQGYLFSKMAFLSRITLIIGAFVLMIPTGAVGLAIANWMSGAIGLGIVALVTFWEWTLREKRKAITGTA